MNYLYVANWKMNMHVNQALRFCTDNYKELYVLSKNTPDSIILCPSFPTLLPIIELLQATSVSIGAQNCSSYKKGAYTGEVSAQSLYEIGCKYCIIGHSERRIMFNETNESIAQKLAQLLDNNIQPIICIGETKEEYSNKKTYAVLTTQLTSIFEILIQYAPQKDTKIIVAYEPVWSIGTGIIPDFEYLKTVLIWLREIIKKNIPQHSTILLYGGSINQENIIQLKRIEEIQGFLIGGSSTDFETFKGIMQ